MNKHSLWKVVSNLLAHWLSKIVKHGYFAINDKEGNLLVSLRTRLPYVLTEVANQDGKILMVVTKEDFSNANYLEEPKDRS